MCQMMSNLTGAEDQLKKLTLIAKIFYMVNTIKIPPFLVEAGRIDNWINFIVFIMEHDLATSDPLIQMTQN